MQFIGFSNYKTVFEDRIFRGALWNMVVFLVLTLLLQMGVGLLLTLLLNRKLPGHRFAELVFFAPVIMSSVIIAYTFLQVFEPINGTINQFLSMLGMSAFRQIWLADMRLALYCVLAANVYQWTGMSIIYYRAGMAVISKDYYEAAEIDGASFWKKVVNITIPLLKNTHVTLILLGTIGTIKFFDLVQIMTQGGPAGATEFPMTYLYKRLSLEARNGLSGAISIICIIMAFIIASVQIRTMKKEK